MVDGKTYDFDVRASFTKFSNGWPVTAANFKAAFDRDADPRDAVAGDRRSWATPSVATNNFFSRIFVSKRVGCFTYDAICGRSLAAMCPK